MAVPLFLERLRSVPANQSPLNPSTRYGTISRCSRRCTSAGDAGGPKLKSGQSGVARSVAAKAVSQYRTAAAAPPADRPQCLRATSPFHVNTCRRAPPPPTGP